MEVQYFFKMIQKKWWLIAATVLIAINLSLFNSYYLVERRYEAVASFIVSPNIQSIETEKDVVSSLQALDRRSILATYAEIINSRLVFESAIELLGSDPVNYDGYETSVVVLPEASVLTFTVQGPDPEVAAALANGIGQYGLDFINNLYQIYQVSFIDRAVRPTIPYQPKVAQDGVLAIVLGLALGVGLVLLQNQLSSTIENIRQRKRIDNESLALSRESYEREIREEIAQEPEINFTVGFVYLSGIQEIYNSLPQAYVNQIMRRVSRILQDHLRGNDIVGRWSNIQFSFLLPSTDGTSARRTMARIQEVIARPFSLDSVGENRISLDPRIGLASRQWGESLSALMDQAEDALEIAKQSETKIELYKVRPFV